MAAVTGLEAEPFCDFAEENERKCSHVHNWAHKKRSQIVPDCRRCSAPKLEARANSERPSSYIVYGRKYQGRLCPRGRAPQFVLSWDQADAVITGRAVGGTAHMEIIGRGVARTLNDNRPADVAKGVRVVSTDIA